jgi:cysteine-rich repeat protein
MGVRGAFAIAMGALVGSSVCGALACITGGTFACTEHADCSGDGVCEPTGWCSFPDESCESRSRYSPWAGDGLAHECTTADDGTTTAFGTDESSEDGGPSGPPAVRDSEGPECGNGIVEVGEACDEDNAIEGDGCNTNCFESGTHIRREMKASLGDDEGHDVVTTAEGEHYVAGRFATQQGNGWLLKFGTKDEYDWTEDYGGGPPDAALGLALVEDTPDDCTPGDVSGTALFVAGYITPYDDPDEDPPPEQANLSARRYEDLGGGAAQCWGPAEYTSQQTVNMMKRYGDDRLVDVAAAPGLPFVVMFGHLRENMNGFDANATARAFPLGNADDLWFWTTGIGGDDDYATGGVVDGTGRIWMVGRRVENDGDIDAWIAHLAVSEADPPVPTRGWTAVVSQADRNDRFEDVALTAAGDLVAVGSKGGRGWVTIWHAETVANGTDDTPFAEHELDTPGDATIYGVAIDSAGAVVVAATVQTADHGTDAWVEKLDPTLTSRIWSHQIDGTAHGDDNARAVAIGAGDVVVVAGDLLQLQPDDVEDGVDRDVWLDVYEP